MARENTQEEAAEKDTNGTRKLNMEEKRKLEKLLLSDIDSAVTRYNAQAEAKRRELLQKLVSNPPAEVKKLFQRYGDLKKQQKEAETKLDTLGYDISYDGSLSANTHGTLTPALISLNERADEGREVLQNLKRTYVIKLFADHADTQSLFSGLSNELARLMK